MVPFRLTHNMVDGFGVSRYEGPFRRSCEVVTRILRLNEATLMTVLEAFLYDPAVDMIVRRVGLMLSRTFILDPPLLLSTALHHSILTSPLIPRIRKTLALQKPLIVLKPSSTKSVKRSRVCFLAKAPLCLWKGRYRS